MLPIIAWRNVWRNKVRSLVVIMSIAVGLWAGIFMMAFAWGMYEQNLEDVIQHQLSHIQIHQVEYGKEMELKDTLSNIQKIRNQLDKVTQAKAYSIRTTVTGMIASPTLSAGVTVNGVDGHSEDNVTQLRSRIVDGEYFTPGRGQALIGQKLADKLKVGIRSKVVVTFQDTHDEIVSAAFRVKGIFRSKNTLFDETQIFLKGTEVNSILGIGNSAHEAALLLHDNAQTDTVRTALMAAMPGIAVESWRQLSPELDLVVSSFNQYMYLFIGVILLALTFGIVNTMLMAVLERYRELGMLMAIGLNKTRVFIMIMLETTFLAAVGGPLGLAVSELTIRLMARHGLDLSAFSEGLSAFGYSSIIYPSLDGSKYIDVFLMTVGVAMLSSIYPALKALRLNPAQAIRKI